MPSSPAIVWFRQDLRLTDNPALQAAKARGRPVIPVFILDDTIDWAPGGASRWWLRHSLTQLQAALATAGSRLTIRRGRSADVLEALIAETGADGVYWNRLYEPAAIRRDTAIKASLRDRGLQARSFNASLLVEPGDILTATGSPYRVYTPFWRALSAMAPFGEPSGAPHALPAPEGWPTSESIDMLRLQPSGPDWSTGLASTWQPGEAGAHQRLTQFVRNGLGHYKTRRNRPDIDGTASLSPHLHWGEVGPRQVWHAVSERLGRGELNGREAQAEVFLKELVWREFSYHLLYHFPTLPDTPLNGRFAAFPWIDDHHAALRAWQRGQTGYPIVDAGMRQLWQTGWMHNRVRMVVASFLTKHLLVPWQAGAEWFWDTLVDADLASNSASWQWVAGCGADAAPYFRIFNPVLQGQKFDPLGAYVSRWVPELDRLPESVIHCPWQAKPDVLARAGVRLGTTYPQPIIDHQFARRRALAAYERIKSEVTTMNPERSPELAL